MADSLLIAEDYHDFLRELKERIVQAQMRAVLSVYRLNGKAEIVRGTSVVCTTNYPARMESKCKGFRAPS